ncbi:MAG: aldo/keto reductase [Bacteroidota bacterium]
MKDKIILGTVQLGLDYGINNAKGKPSQEEAFAILDYAFENDIHILDSADVYGNALEVIGDHKRKSGKEFSVINKFKVDGIPLATKLRKNLDELNCESLSCYMFHAYADYEGGTVAKELNELKSKGLIERTGVSIYTVDQLRVVATDDAIDVIQLPANIFDFSSEKQELLERARNSEKEIHVRSVFLQGIFMKDPSKLTGNLLPLAPYLERLGKICDISSVEMKDAALNFIIHNKNVDYVVLGIEHVAQLKENLALVHDNFDAAPFNNFEIGKEDQFLLNPANWKP